MNYISDSLTHYGMIGMKWGIKRLEKRIVKSKRAGDKEKTAVLKNRLGQQKQIQKMAVSDKIFLSREGTLANARLIAKGESKVTRLLKLHGINMVSNATSSHISKTINGEIQRSSILDNLPMGKQVAAKTIASIGTSVIVGNGVGAVRDSIYKKM